MERKEFKTAIDAPKEKVWDVLWNDETYRQWTTPFSEGSYAEEYLEEFEKAWPQALQKVKELSEQH